MLIDLQLHSNYSDGYLTPSELALFLKNRKVKIASLTDHNTLAGQEEFARACRKAGIKAIPGLELYVKLNGKRFSLLWYNFNDDHDLHSILRESQVRRKNLVRKRLMLLVALGFHIKIESLLDKYGHYVAINHLIDDLLKDPANRKIVRKKLGQNFREEEVIKKYFSSSELSRLNESHIEVERIIKLRKKLGGQLVFNHPGKYSQLDRAFLRRLKKLGFDGIEVLSPHHGFGTIMYAQYLARELKFITTGGSDYHRSEGSKALIKSAHDYFRIDSKLLEGIEKIIG